MLETALKVQAEIPLELLMEWREQADNNHDVAGFDGYNGDLTGDKAATLGVNCGMSTGRNGVVSPPIAFACNQRDEVRDLNDVAGAVQAQPGMKQQTFVAESTECLTPWDVQSRRVHREDGVWPALYGGEGGGHGYVQAGCLNGWETQQARVFTPGGVAPTLAGADGAGGRNPAGLVLAAGVVSKGNGDCFITPEQHTALTSGGGQAGQGYPCVMAAAFCAGAGAKAGSIGYEMECAPTFKGSEGGNIMPSVICLNDQGGQRMDVSENHVGTLRSQMDGHPPLVMATQQGGAEICEDLCPTMARYVYADNAATTPISKEVLSAMLPYLKDDYGNPSSLHRKGRDAAKAVRLAREKVASGIGALPSEIFFTSGGSEADNWAIKGVAERLGKEGKNHIVTASFEHHAVLNTCRKLELEGFAVTRLNPNPLGFVRAEDVAAAIREDTALVTIMYANNEIGTIQPIAEIGALCRERAVLFHTDAVQAAGNVEIDVAEQVHRPALPARPQIERSQRDRCAVHPQGGERPQSH